MEQSWWEYGGIKMCFKLEEGELLILNRQARLVLNSVTP